ncbi:MAG TPA: methyltransferase domain-containing protein [Candidatus Tectomicrobia bacterium]|nr:methyltransferase domain-containing protein [Candidatus Tectomicrobia bacterium]
MPKPRQPWIIALCLILAIAGVWAAGSAQTRTPDVIYVPTPDNVVAEMLRLTGVRKDDVVYDLGCGDGRLVISAAKRFGARGVGIDIDPQRVRESRVNARKAGVTKRVKFLEQDLFEADIREATVVTLYLLPKLNVELRPKLLRDLRPGTRVVSHDFDMAEWRPDRTVQVKGPVRQHSVYYWVIPASVDGVWHMSLTTPSGVQPYVLRLQQQFQEVRGSMRAEGNDIPISNATLTGDRLRFTVTTGEKAKMAFDGRVDTNAMSGRVEVQGRAMTDRYHWTAQRQAADATTAPPR